MNLVLFYKRYTRKIFIVIVTVFAISSCYDKQISHINYSMQFDTIATLGNENWLEIRNESSIFNGYRLVRWESFVLAHEGAYYRAIRKDSLFEENKLLIVVNYENKDLKDTLFLFDNHPLKIKIKKDYKGWTPLDMVINSYDQDGVWLSSEYRLFDESYWLTKEYKFAYYDDSNHLKYIFTYHGADPIKSELIRTEEYDKYGHLITEEGPLGKKYYEYDSLGNCLRRTYCYLNLTELNEFDADGRVIKTTSIKFDTLENVLYYEYDRNGRLTSKVLYYMAINNVPQFNSFVRNSYEYDDNGRISIERELSQRKGKIEKNNITKYDYNDIRLSVKQETIDLLNSKNLFFQYRSINSAKKKI